LARALSRLSGRRIAGAEGVSRDGPSGQETTPLWDPLGRELQPKRVSAGAATTSLYAKLDRSDLAEMEARLGGAEADWWARDLPEPERMHLALALCLRHVPGVAEKTGLSPVDPPEDVHAMERGLLGTGGSYYYADLVAEALEAAGGELRRGTRALDFGCSSGRVVRVLGAAYPRVEWHGCDPNERSIRWAEEHLPGIRFARAPQDPPLPYRDGFFDFAFAVGIWSNFGERAALDWFEEMRRVLRPGGHLIATAHGWHTLHWLASRELWRRSDVAAAARDLYARGFSFWDVFGEEGDWGIKDPEWGFGLISPEWLGARLLPRWALVEFEPGRVEENQDLIVLERRV
jgi:SAM-dependent methyltransferase